MKFKVSGQAGGERHKSRYVYGGRRRGRRWLSLIGLPEVEKVKVRVHFRRVRVHGPVIFRPGASFTIQSTLGRKTRISYVNKEL